MFLGVSGTVCGVDIQSELTDAGREAVAGRLLVEQRIRFKGSKKAAYTAAGVNSATWERAITKQRVRPDRLVQIVTSLWPESGGDWQLVPPAAQVRKAVFPADLDAVALLADWVREAAQSGHETPPPTEALTLWDFEQLVEGVRLKHDEDMGLRELDESIASSEIDDLRARLAAKEVEGGDGNVDADDDAGDSAPTKPAARSQYARAARKGTPALKKKRQQHDEETEAVPEDRTGMEPI